MTVVPSEKEKKESTALSLVVEEWKDDEVEQFSPVQRINGYSWRLRLFKKRKSKRCGLALICDRSSKKKEWECKARVTSDLFTEETVHSFSKTNSEQWLVWVKVSTGDEFKVEIEMEEEDEFASLRTFGAPDGVLVIGKDKKKILVNMKSLSSKSPYFDRLFNGNFKEKIMHEITIEDVEYEHFSNVIRIGYGLEGASLMDESVLRVLQIATKFEFKVVRDKVVSFLNSSFCSLSLQQKLLTSEKYNIPSLKANLLAIDHSNSQLRELCKSDELGQLSLETLRVIFRMFGSRIA